VSDRKRAHRKEGGYARFHGYEFRKMRGQLRQGAAWERGNDFRKDRTATSLIRPRTGRKEEPSTRGEYDPGFLLGKGPRKRRLCINMENDDSIACTGGDKKEVPIFQKGTKYSDFNHEKIRGNKAGPFLAREKISLSTSGRESGSGNVGRV